MKLLLILLTFLSLKLPAQKLILKCDTMYKIIYSDDMIFADAVQSDSYETLKFNTKPKKIIVNFKSKYVQFGGKRFKIEEVLEPEVGIFHILELKRRKTIYDLFIADNCKGGLTLILRYFDNGDVICRYFPTIQLTEVKY